MTYIKLINAFFILDDMLMDLCFFHRPQHLTGLQLIRDICQGRLQGDAVKSTEIHFQPGYVKAGDFLADTHTAGYV